MFNFLDSKLSPKVVCKFPATDNYEVENLISDQYAKKIRGFIAYSAIKPPVEIEFQFICPVNIHYIILNTTVGNQRCTGIEIFSKNSILPYVSICRSVYDKSGIVFCNSRKYSNANPPPNYNSNFELCFFKSITFKSFLKSSSIKVVIFRTEKSVPCLASIEVWGIPSKSCSPVTVQTINRIMQKTETTLQTLSQPVETVIPEDFKDDLTYDLMTIPMTLPSGKTVDQSTLDKHVKSEALFGRKPCDPFTGIKFTEKIKPVLNVALKSRIDMFLLQNSSFRTENYDLVKILGKGDSNISEKSKRKFECNDKLDEAIKKAKQDLNVCSFDEKVCSLCKSSEYLYLIPCEHCYCRKCLLEICRVLKCSICNKEFFKSNVKKFNL